MNTHLLTGKPCVPQETFGFNACIVFFISCTESQLCGGVYHIVLEPYHFWAHWPVMMTEGTRRCTMGRNSTGRPTLITDFTVICEDKLESWCANNWTNITMRPWTHTHTRTRNRARTHDDEVTNHCPR